MDRNSQGNASTNTPHKLPETQELPGCSSATDAPGLYNRVSKQNHFSS